MEALLMSPIPISVPLSEGASATVEVVLELAEVSVPSPFTPPLTPVLAIRAAASAGVVQVGTEPGFNNKGNSKQTVGGEQPRLTYFPATH